MVAQVKLDLSPQEARDAILRGESLSGRTINGSLDLGGATIDGFLDLTGAAIKGSLYLAGATINRSLYLGGATISGSLDFSTKFGPNKIYVHFEMAERVRWAAPNVPLVVSKPSH